MNLKVMIVLAWLAALVCLGGEVCVVPPAPVGAGVDDEDDGLELSLSMEFPENISAEIDVGGGRLTVRIRFPAAVESRAHQLWHWNESRRIYDPGLEVEDAATLLWLRDPDSGGGMADAWVWRAARTDPAGHADDLNVGAKLADERFLELEFLPDTGELCWESRFPADFAGTPLPRFHHRAPSGSQADVRAKGEWSDGWWTVTFSRRLDTGHADDLDFRGGPLHLLVAPGPPRPTVDLNDFKPVLDSR